MEEEKVFNRKKFTWIYCGLMFLIAAVSMGFMLRYAYTKVIIVSAEEAESQMESEAVREEKPRAVGYKIDFKSTDDSGCFVIPFTEGEGETVGFYSEINKKQATLVFKKANSDYFRRNAPSGDFTGVTGITEEIGEDEIRVRIDTEENVYVRVKVQGKKVYVTLEPIDKDEVLVVLDPLYGGAHSGTIAGDVVEKEVNLRIALKVRELAKDKPYRVELTRDGDETVMTDERLEIIDMLGADYYIGIGMNTDMEDTTVFGMKAFYNDALYRNGFENVDFAECVLRNAALTASDKALALSAAGEENVILKVIDIPGTLLLAGTITNVEEASILTNEAYLERIAVGIIKALDGVVK